MEWIVHGTGIVPVEKATGKRNSYSFYYKYVVHAISLYSCSVWVLLPYSVMQQDT